MFISTLVGTYQALFDRSSQWGNSSMNEGAMFTITRTMILPINSRVAVITVHHEKVFTMKWASELLMKHCLFTCLPCVEAGNRQPWPLGRSLLFEDICITGLQNSWKRIASLTIMSGWRLIAKTSTEQNVKTNYAAPSKKAYTDCIQPRLGLNPNQSKGRQNQESELHWQFCPQRSSCLSGM